MLKNRHKSSGKLKTPFKAYYNVIAKACKCSSKYAKLVLEGGSLGTYKGKVYSQRDTPLTRRIKAKDQELRRFINPEE